MAYNYYPASYQVPQAYQPQQNNGIVWVQGEAAARSYIVPAGQSALLMDSEASCFYIKSTDASGMPLPLRVFEYTERTQNVPSVSEKSPDPSVFDPEKYVTKEELEESLKKLKSSMKKKGKEDE